MEISFASLSSFSYVEALKINKTVQKIKSHLSGEHRDEYANYGIDDHCLKSAIIMLS